MERVSHWRCHYIGKGTTVSAQTDIDGNFSINVPANGILIISYIGYKTTEVEVNGRTTFMVSIEELKKELNELLSWAIKAKNVLPIAGAVSTVNVDNVSKIPIGFADQALQGQVIWCAHHSINGQPGDGLAMRIRGVGSVNNNDPLYIIDGVPTQDGINFLAADDIASITV